MNAAPFELFLARARRHWTAWMITEHAALGLLGGCVCVLLLLPILLWRGEPGQSVGIVFPLLGLVAGAVAGFGKRPALRDVARLADDRFATADLLATALSIGASTDPWYQNILKSADACAMNLRPAALTPHRLGRRAWSGVLLSLIAAITLGALSITTPTSRTQAAQASTEQGARNDSWDGAAANPDPARAETLPQESPASREARAEAASDSQSMPDDGETAASGQAAEKRGSTPGPQQAQAGTGTGSARTSAGHDAASTIHPGATISPSPANGTNMPSGDGYGIQSNSGTNSPLNGESGGTVWAGQQTAEAPSSTSGWPAAQTAASHAVQDGMVPDAYRALVRDYFGVAADQAAASARH
jgi:hypothetical protein